MNHYVSPIKNMGFTAKKYGVSVSFCFKLTFLVKPKANTFLILIRNLNNFKIHKNLCNGPLCITDPEYWFHVHKIWSFDQFLPQTRVFR
jgi:hypothetical protein